MYTSPPHFSSLGIRVRVRVRVRVRIGSGLWMAASEVKFLMSTQVDYKLT